MGSDSESVEIKEGKFHIVLGYWCVEYLLKLTLIKRLSSNYCMRIHKCKNELTLLVLFLPYCCETFPFDSVYKQKRDQAIESQKETQRTIQVIDHIKGAKNLLTAEVTAQQKTTTKNVETLILRR